MLVTIKGNNQVFLCPECGQEASLTEGSSKVLRTAVFVNRLKDQYTQLEKAISKVFVRSQKKLYLDKVEILVEESMANLEKEITCSVCLNICQQPKVLPCLHFYCKECILRLAIMAEDVWDEDDLSVLCPKCCMKGFLPEGLVNNLQTAFFINRLKDHYTQLEKALGKVMVKSLKQLSQDKVKIFSLPVNSFLHTINEVVVHQVSEFVLGTATLHDSKVVKFETMIDCHLNSLYNGSIIECSVQDLGAGEYYIQYTPTVRGRHELSISVDKQPVAGSPFPVLVCSPPTLLDKPVKVLDGVRYPGGITVNSVGEIIVAEYRDVVVMDKDGTRLRTINSLEHQIRYLQGVAVDCEDNIYFIDERTNRICKSNKNCTKVQVHRVRQVGGPGHISVAVVGDEVMVTELYNRGVIMVYNRELEHVRQILGTNDGPLCGLCADGLQNVYACDNWSSSIQVFGKDGEPLRYFGREGNSITSLRYPLDVAVAGQYVYVTDSLKGSVTVFSAEGEYLTSFGNGYITNVCVDQDRFVYVTNYSVGSVSKY